MSNTIQLKRFDGLLRGDPSTIFPSGELVWDYTRKSLRIGDGSNIWSSLVEFPTQSVTSFLALTDTPATYGLPGQVPVVNEAGTGLDFATVAVTNGGVLIQSKAKVTLAKGQPVFITPGNAAVPDVDLCDNTSTTKSRVYGIATTGISAGNTGYIQRSGILTNVDTRTSNTTLNPNAETWLEGDLLFATTNGGLTKVRPTSGRSVKVGYSVKGSNNTDSIVLHPMENPVWLTAAASENVVLRLGDNAGTNKVSIRDYANNEVASINSDGLFTGILPTATADVLGGVKVGSRLTITNGVLSADAQGGGLSNVSSNDTTPGYLNGKLVAGSGITLTENNNGANETLSIGVAATYQSSASYYTLPGTPTSGLLVDVVGIGNNWRITAPAGYYIRMGANVSAAAGNLSSTVGYDCASLIYIGSNIWTVKTAMGSLTLDAA